jgi:hypothetical protein
LENFFNTRNAWIKIQAHEQEYQAIGQEVQELELTKRSQVLFQDVSIAHDILPQDIHVFCAHATRSSTRDVIKSYFCRGNFIFVTAIFHFLILFISSTNDIMSEHRWFHWFLLMIRNYQMVSSIISLTSASIIFSRNYYSRFADSENI